MAFDPWDFTSYQHPPCMFLLWYAFTLANYLLGTIEPRPEEGEGEGAPAEGEAPPAPAPA